MLERGDPSTSSRLWVDGPADPIVRRRSPSACPGADPEDYVTDLASAALPPVPASWTDLDTEPTRSNNLPLCRASANSLWACLAPDEGGRYSFKNLPRCKGYCAARPMSKRIDACRRAPHPTHPPCDYVSATTSLRSPARLVFYFHPSAMARARKMGAAGHEGGRVSFQEWELLKSA